MSASVAHDIAVLISELGYGELGKGIYDPQLLALRKPVHGVLVEQRNTAPMPDVLNGDDVLYVNIQVRGEGGGEKGKRAAYDKAMAIYRDLRLVMDRTIDGTFYELITPDSAPYEVQDGQFYDYLFGLEVTRYFLEDVTDGKD
ncbi:hypothetical protein JS82_05255 [Methanomassiliicoccaceae archaeon DOK]|nr:hypothetical protein JS82_05255 [Methanomassiliicoccaceae archaeon DOK]